MRTLSGRPASQREFELSAYTNLMKYHGVTSYCEVGARHGDTFYHVMKTLPKGSRGLAIDLPGALWGTKSGGHLRRAVERLRQEGYRVEMCLASSQSKDALAAAAHGWDSILVDADHTYSAARADFLAYLPLAFKMIALHDIDGEGMKEKVHGTAVEVPRLWKEISPQAGQQKLELIDYDNRGMGIGVLTLGGGT